MSDWSSDVCSSDLRGRFAGLHYFNPVSMMPLVELVRHDTMDAETARRLAAFCRAIDKLPVPVAGSPGFLDNRVLFPYMIDAIPRPYALSVRKECVLTARSRGLHYHFKKQIA